MRKPLTILSLLSTACILAVFAVSRATTGSAAADDFAKVAVPFLSKHCFECHGPNKKPKAGLAFHVYKDAASVLKDRKVWTAVLHMVRAGEMPPKEKPRPTLKDAEAFAAVIDNIFIRADSTAKRDPGQVTMRRLNRVEYRNTIRDLVGVDFDASELPQDDVGYGFDNIGDVLTISPLLMERYLSAADSIVSRAFPIDFPEPVVRRRFASGPMEPKIPASRLKLLAGTDPKGDKIANARTILTRFATRAYRRPATADEVQRLVRLAEQGEKNTGKWEAGLQLALQAVLCSPKFLFRVELNQRPDSADPHPIDDYQLASRMSYFLWNTMPDDELFALAEKNQLHKEVAAQVRRMLKDDRADTLVENFGMQWLQLRPLNNFAPDTKLFPEWNESLRQAMLKETELFLRAVMREDRSILDIVDADFTFLNERLATHYGITDPKVQGAEFRRVQLKGGERGGVLTQASILAVNSNPTRTSPVKRGRWVLEQILGTPPPPPPPDVPALDSEKQLKGTLRQRMEQHRANPSCAFCHARMDPIGFAFENYNAIGKFRTTDGGRPIDPSGVLPNGQTFKGPGELKAILKGKKDLFSRNLTEKMLTYALGRGLEYYDRPAVDRIVAALAQNDYRFSVLVTEVVKSDPFSLRRGKDQK